MRTELAWIEKTENYLMGNLSSDDQKEFEARFEQDPQLKLQVDFQRRLMDGIWSMALKGAAAKGFQLYKLKRLFWKIGCIALIGGTVVFSIIYWTNSRAGEPASPTIEGTGLPIAGDTSAARNLPAKQQVFLKMDLKERPKDLQIYEDPAMQNTVESKTVNSNWVPIQNPVIDNVSVPENLEVVRYAEDKSWTITANTTKEDLKRIGGEISAADGTLNVLNTRYSGGKLVRISFIVTNKSGQVRYDSPDLGENGKVCISFPQAGGISAGWCGEE